VDLSKNNDDINRLHGAIFIEEEKRKEDEIKQKGEIKNCTFWMLEGPMTSCIVPYELQ
jgi:hypothetical protein